MRAFRDRVRMIGIRVSQDERDMLDVCAERAGVSPSDVVRLAIRAEYAELAKTAPPPPPSKLRRA